MLINPSLYPQNSPIYQNNNPKNRNIAFGQAWVNILSMADNHGKISTLPAVFDTIRRNFGNIFPNANSQNTLNIFAHIGDMLINPAKKGFLSVPRMNSGDMQFSMFKTLFSSTRKLFKTPNYVATYTPGNHCFDGGVSWLLSMLKNANFDTIITNAKVPEQKGIFGQKIYTVADDKKPHLKHKVLVLGLVPTNLEFYVPKKLLRKISVTDACKKSYGKFQETDLTRTIEDLRKIIEAFKRKHPHGAVLLQAHTDEQVSKIITEHIPGINLILNAHEHKNEIKSINGIPTVFHGQDNEFVRGVRLFFDDNGNPSIRSVKTFYTRQGSGAKKNPLAIFLQLLSRKDLKPILRLTNHKGELCNLDRNGVRSQHNLLANFVTDVVYNKLRRKHPHLRAAGIVSSAFRGGLKNKSTNLDIMGVLDGSPENVSEMYFAKLKGSALLKILTENVQANIKNPERNSIIQWSGIKVNKSAGVFQIKSQNGARRDNYQSIDPKKVYEIALPLKYVQKYCPEELKSSFKPTGETLNNMFMEHMKTNNYNIRLDSNIYQQRIID